jgi:hypothetical protein
MSERLPSLAEEAFYLHESLFRLPMDAAVAQRYEAAHGKLFPDEKTSPAVARVVSRRLDVEAVEFALRRRRSGAELTRKIQILCYLVEVRQRYQSHFIATNRGLVRGTMSLLGAALHSACKFCKGEYLIRRHGLLRHGLL